jgi:hypothetical protein
MKPWNTDPTGWRSPAGARRRGQGTTAPIGMRHFGVFQGTTLFGMPIADGVDTEVRWLLEHSP